MKKNVKDAFYEENKERKKTFLYICDCTDSLIGLYPNQSGSSPHNTKLCPVWQWFCGNTRSSGKYSHRSPWTKSLNAPS